MEAINAVGKVRFSSARPQRVHLVPKGPVQVDLLCLESGQEMPIPGNAAVVYVVSGSAVLTDPTGPGKMSPGQLTAPPVDAKLSNPAEQRLVCLLYRAGS